MPSHLRGKDYCSALKLDGDFRGKKIQAGKTYFRPRTKIYLSCTFSQMLPRWIPSNQAMNNDNNNIIQEMEAHTLEN